MKEALSAEAAPSDILSRAHNWVGTHDHTIYSVRAQSASMLTHAPRWGDRCVEERRGHAARGEGTNKTRLRRQLVVLPSGQTTNPHDARASHTLTYVLALTHVWTRVLVRVRVHTETRSRENQYSWAGVRLSRTPDTGT